MKIEGHINIWFNPNSLFKMQFNQVDVQEALDMLQLIRNALKDVQDKPQFETSPLTGEVIPRILDEGEQTS